MPSIILSYYYVYNSKYSIFRLITPLAFYLLYA